MFSDLFNGSYIVVCRGVVQLGGQVSKYYQGVPPRWELESSVIRALLQNKHLKIQSIRENILHSQCFCYKLIQRLRVSCFFVNIPSIILRPDKYNTFMDPNQTHIKNNGRGYFIFIAIQRVFGLSDFLMKGQLDIVLFSDFQCFLSDSAPSLVNTTEQTLPRITSLQVLFHLQNISNKTLSNLKSTKMCFMLKSSVSSVLKHCLFLKERVKNVPIGYFSRGEHI